MSLASRHITTAFWEVLVLVPFVLLFLSWISIVVIGLVDASLIEHIRSEIERVMILLLIVCFACFGLGLVGLVAHRRRHEHE